MNSDHLDWRDTHRTYSLWGLTDPNAPVQAGGEIVIDAERLRVWDALTNVREWAQLRSDIHCVSVDGPIQQGATCTLETSGITLLITFGLVVAPREVNWTTSTPGLVMTNRYVLVPEEGSTRVVSRETIDAPSYPQFDEAELTSRIRVWLSALKHLVEGRRDGDLRPQGDGNAT